MENINYGAATRSMDPKSSTIYVHGMKYHMKTGRMMRDSRNRLILQVDQPDGILVWVNNDHWEFENIKENKMQKKDKIKVIENFIRKEVRKNLKENYAFLLKGPNDFYKLKSYFSASTPKDWNDVLVQDAKFMKLCQNMVSHLQSLEN